MEIDLLAHIKEEPFSQGLEEQCKKHPFFSKALKIYESERFITFRSLICSTCPHYPHQFLGQVVYDNIERKLKQDFIVNKAFKNKEFILHTALPEGKRTYYQCKYVDRIDIFTEMHKGHNCYEETHYPNLDSLPPEIQELIKQELSKSKLSYLIQY